MNVNDLIERLRSVKWDVIAEGDRMPDDPTHKCVFVDMRPNDFLLVAQQGDVLAPVIAAIPAVFRARPTPARVPQRLLQLVGAGDGVHQFARHALHLRL